jgi:hypothetical protein
MEFDMDTLCDRRKKGWIFSFVERHSSLYNCIPNIDRNFPYQIELPPSNDPNRLDAMKAFVASVDYRMRTEGIKYRWCFSNLDLARWFQDEFGGLFFDLSENEP